MKTPIAEQILGYAAPMPEGTPLMAKALLHLGSRAAVDQALSRLVHQGKLIRSGRGLYVRPTESRFGIRAPAPEKVVSELAKVRGETVTSHGAAAANRLGLTTQIPMRTIYLTSGRTRHLKLGAQDIELQHAPSWQLTNAGRPSGDVLRALVWAGRPQAHAVLALLKERLAPEVRAELVASRAALPGWLAETISAELAA
jgi:hypothetical protein